MRTFLLLTYSITIEYIVLYFFISNDILILNLIYIIYLYRNVDSIRIYLRLPKSFRSHPLKTREIKIESDWMDWLNSKRFFFHRRHPPTLRAQCPRHCFRSCRSVYSRLLRKPKRKHEAFKKLSGIGICVMTLN